MPSFSYVVRRFTTGPEAICIPSVLTLLLMYKKFKRNNAETMAGCRNKTQLFGGKELPEGEVLWK